MSRYGRSSNPESVAESFDTIKSDYAAIRHTRFRRRRIGVNTAGSGADFHYRNQGDYLRLMEAARDMDRNDAIVGSTVDRAKTNIVQQGFTLDPQTGDPGLSKILSDRWKDWSEDPNQSDLAGELTFYEMERLIQRSVTIDGDFIVLPNVDGPLQLIEAHRLRTPSGTKKNVVHGVLLDENRKRLQYWLTKEDINPLTPLRLVSDTTPFDARDSEGNKQVFHIYNPKRVSQTRGVTALAPIFDVLGMFEDINFAKLVQQQVVSCFAVFRERELEFKDGPAGDDNKRGGETTDTFTDNVSRTITGIAPGMEINGKPGEKLQGFSPNVPNAEFFEHVNLILTLVGINLGLPLILVLLDARQTNFSGWRGALDQARLGFREMQKCLEIRFHRPVYRFKVRQWMATDPAIRTAAGKTGVDPFRHRWNPPTWPYIEPMKDATADLLRLRNGMISPRRQQAERGRDFNDVAQETVDDNTFAITAAKTRAAEMNKLFPDDPVHWRELWPAPTSVGMKVEINANESELEGTSTNA